MSDIPDPQIIGTFSPRVITETITWVPVGRPATCDKCHHEHYPRKPDPNPRNVAAQWNFCEDPACPCTSLHVGVFRG